jgi:hypothetical protein
MFNWIFRWTIGDISLDGLDLFQHAIKRTIQSFGPKFRYVICSNAQQLKQKIEKLASIHKIEYKQCEWCEFPLPDGVCEPNPTDRQGSFWKLCPARINIDTHELVVDSDVLFLNRPGVVDTFLSSNIPLVCQENIECSGKYHSYLNGACINSGLFGLPPGYDFAKELVRYWQAAGSMKPLLSRDEQGLVNYTLTRNDHLKLTSDSLVPLLANGKAKYATYDYALEHGYTSKTINEITMEDHVFTSRDDGYHFCQINRMPHRYWERYKCCSLL